MNINLEQANELELLTYKIAILSMVVSCNEQLTKIKDKLDEVQKKREQGKFTDF
jgi:hypothetical protein|tara:strand:- start:98 stop:259 length:162 start_codon:yes stop_codon:yes gene_type:complete